MTKPIVLITLLLFPSCATAAPAPSPPPAPAPAEAQATKAQAWRQQRATLAEERHRKAREMREEDERKRLAYVAQEEAEREQQKAAKEAKAQAAAAEELQEARASGVCAVRGGAAKGSADLPDGSCVQLHRQIIRACAAIESIKEGHAQAAEERRQSKKFGVVNLATLEDIKNHTGAREDDLAEAKEEIRDIRGKPFSPRECK